MPAFDARPAPPPPNRWQLPSARAADEHDLVGVGADLAPGTLIAAYRSGLFPMPLGRRMLGRQTIGWWSPDPRGVIPLDGLRVSRSLRRSCRRYEVRWNTAFTAVMAACADPHRPDGWITTEFLDAYGQLHEMGWAHSVETYDRSGALVGGLYGVRIGRFFAGESMFHRATDASKVALVALVERMRSESMALLDVQWNTPHLASLGAVDISRDRYLTALAEAVDCPTAPLN
jgi:leucyl/phenylalanyl-tRNA---protein transferase